VLPLLNGFLSLHSVRELCEPQPGFVSFAEYSCQTEISLELHLVLDSSVSRHQHILLLVKRLLKKCQLGMPMKLLFV